MCILYLVIDTSFLKRVFFEETVANYLWFIGIIFATILFKHFFASLLTRFGGRMTHKFSYVKHKKEMKNMLLKPVEQLLEIVLFFIAFNQISDFLDNIEIYHLIIKKGKFVIKLGDVVEHIFLFLFILFLTKVITHIVDFIYFYNFNKAQEEKNHSALQLLPLLKEVSKFVIWVLSIFWALGSVFHVNIPALITGLGIGGVAIALAGKETIENFFAAFTILSDKPFQVGDHIKFGDLEGFVERIGFRSTRIRAFDAAAIVVPNQKLVSQNLINLSSRTTQGMKIVLNIRYGISEEKLYQLSMNLKNILITTPLVKPPIDIFIETFNPDTLQLIINYHLPNPIPEGYEFMTIRKEISLKVYGIIAEMVEIGNPVISNLK